MSLAPGFRLGPYKILSEIGKGGMGEVYKAIDSRLGREVAIKVLPEHLVEDPDALRRFEREAKALAALSHPNILTIFDVGADQGISFVVMELLEGESLRARMGHSELPWEKTLEIAVPIAEGLSAAHSKGVVHRDLKPENIFLTADGRVKILDFGLARLVPTFSQEGLTEAPTKSREMESLSVSGTVPYMSPEQVSGKPVDARSDIFSFGCMLYEMLAGNRPFSGDSTAETVAAILKETPRSATELGKQIPPELDHLVMHCLEKSPDLRLQSARDLTFALREVLTSSATSKVAPVASRVPRQRFPPTVWATGLALLIIGIAVSVYWSGRTRKTIESIAVLPFENVGGDENTEYLSDGITDSIINNLSQLPDLTVMSHNSVFRYKGHQTDAQAAGRDLKVQAVLTGRLVWRGDNVSLSAELVDVRNAGHIWGDQYNQKLADILAAQEEISKQIVEKLRLKLTGEQQKQLAKHYTPSNEAYQLYLKGLYFGRKNTADGVNKAIHFFQQAIDKDPKYAAAYGGLAGIYAQLPFYGTPPGEVFPKAMEAATRAISLDETLAEAHNAMGGVHFFYKWNWEESEKEFRRAIALNPNYDQAYRYLGRFLINMGRFDEALLEIRRAKELDPLSVNSTLLLAAPLVYKRQYDQAILQIKEALEMDPNFLQAFYWLAGCYVRKGMFQEAIAMYQKGYLLEKDPDLLAGQAVAYALWGKSGDAQKLLGQLNEAARSRYVNPYRVAEVYAALGEKDRAFELLQEAYEARQPTMTYLKVDFAWDGLRSDPRFVDLLQRMRFPTTSK